MHYRLEYQAARQLQKNIRFKRVLRCVDGQRKDAVLHARISIGDTEVWAADIPNAEPMRSAYLMLRVDSDGEAEHVFSALSDSGQILKEVAEYIAVGFVLPADQPGVAPYRTHTELLSTVAEMILFQEEEWFLGLDSN